jgi:hypothetical protein
LLAHPKRRVTLIPIASHTRPMPVVDFSDRESVAS